MSEERTPRELLELAAALRVPLWRTGPDAKHEELRSPYEKLDALEEYSLTCGFYQGELHEARLRAYEELVEHERRWADVQPITTRNKTETAREDSKREANPALWEALRETRWLIARLTEEVDRLERDKALCSRIWGRYSGG